MCGIVGIISRNPVPHRAWLSAGRDAMRHRGPDDFGEWWSDDSRVGLGHRRLSIIDLSPAGHQPMSYAGGAMQLVYNGEIYNFRELRRHLVARGHLFESECDTEVILGAYREWGPECIARLNGMFAFALYDRELGQLLIARDRAGEKPLFYSLLDGSLRFASELKALLADPSFPRRVDPEGLDCYLGIGYVPGERCILRDARKLPPGHALLFDQRSGRSHLWRYWDLPELATSGNDASVPEAAMVDELETLLERGVRRQLVADVPIGILLSGGVDSSLVTAMAIRAVPQVKTFTIRFPGAGRFDETEHARLIARHFGTTHMELEAGEASVELLPMLARQFDEPLADASMIPTYLVSRLVREHCTVALGGDGGDELFGGYPHYNRLAWMQQRLKPVPRPLRQALARGAAAALPVGFKGRNWLQTLEADLESGLPRVATLFDPETRRRLLSYHAAWTPVAEEVWIQRTPRSPDLLQRATRMDFTNYLPDDILVKVDRASMLNSLEMRSPLLDQWLIEFAFQQVPSTLKASASSRKVLLKKLAMRVLPPQFDHRRKQGLEIPLASWLENGPWLGFFRDVLLGSDSPLFNRQVVKGLLNGQSRGRANGSRLFALVMFELWRREYQPSV